MYIKRIFAFMLSAVLLTTGISSFAEEKTQEEILDCINIEERVKQAEADGHRYAYITQADSKLEMVNGNVGTNRWNTNERSSSIGLYQFETIVHQGKKAINSTATDQSNVFIFLEGEYWKTAPKERMAVTIEYIDIENASLGINTATNFHRLAAPMSTELEAVRTTGSGEWKTITYFIDDFTGDSLRLRVPSIQPFIGIPNRVPTSETDLCMTAPRVAANLDYLVFTAPKNLDGRYEITFDMCTSRDVGFTVVCKKLKP